MIKAIKSYETSDGETFTRREDAERHEATIAVQAWIDGCPLDVELDVSAGNLVRLIMSDPERARAVLMPLMPVKRPRVPKGRAPKKPAAATAAEYEAILAGAGA